ncbi:hypothetical protein JW835_06420 [bacterium]|nr:hypothetical protein [bacterium]
MICFVLTLPDILFDIAIKESFYNSAHIFFYRVFNLLIILPVILKMRGFISLARHYKNDFLLVSAYLLMLFDIADRIVSATFLYHTCENLEKLIGFVTLLTVGCACLFFGAGLVRLKKVSIPYAGAAGWLNIAVGICFVLIIPFFIGLLLLIPLEILEILLFYNVSKMFE